MSEQQTIEKAYETAHESALIVQHDTPGVIELRGADRVDLLHRLSTNDLENMPANRVIRTVFTDPVGRTIDVVTVLTLPDELLIVTSSGRSKILQDWLRQHIFFQDEVTVHISVEEGSLYGAYVPRLPTLCRRLFHRRESSSPGTEAYSGLSIGRWLAISGW